MDQLMGWAGTGLDICSQSEEGRSRTSVLAGRHTSLAVVQITGKPADGAYTTTYACARRVCVLVSHVAFRRHQTGIFAEF